MINLQDVAKRANVSIATVSRTLNNSPLVNAATKEKVRKVVRELNYQPNYLARNLRRGETKIIMCTLISMSSFFFTEFNECFRGMWETAYKSGYKVILCPVELSKNMEREFLTLLKNKMVDGVILANSMMGNEELSSLAKQYPLVQCSEYRPDLQLPYVTIDNQQAAAEAVQHLIQIGHKRIGMISSIYDISNFRLREAGYRQALQEAGLEVDQKLIKFGKNEYDNGMEITKQFLAMKDRPTAIFCISDTLARGCLEELIINGFQVPEDIAVVGFDNSIMSRLYWPKITTVNLPLYELGEKSMEIMLSQLQGKAGNPGGIILPHQLIIRESTVKQPQ